MRKAAPVFLGVVILIGVGAVFLTRQLRHVFPGPYYDQSNSRDLQKVLGIASDSRPLREALERFKNEHDDYPMSVANLIPTLLQPTNAPENFMTKDWGGWEYQRESTNAYKLYFQLDWDGGLWFEHVASGTNQWSWSTSDRVVDLTRKFQLR